MTSKTRFFRTKYIDQKAYASLCLTFGLTICLMVLRRYKFESSGMCCQALYLSEIGPCDVAMESRNILYEVLGMNQKGNDKKNEIGSRSSTFSDLPVDNTLWKSNTIDIFR